MSFWGALQPHKENTASSLNLVSASLPPPKHQSAKPLFPAKKSRALPPARWSGAAALLRRRCARRAVRRERAGQGKACPAAEEAPAQVAGCERTVITGPTSDRFKPFTSLVSDHSERTWKTWLWPRQAVEESEEHSVTRPVPTALGWIPAHFAPFKSCHKACFCRLLPKAGWSFTSTFIAHGCLAQPLFVWRQDICPEHQTGYSPSKLEIIFPI